MFITEHEQNTLEWFQDRLGKITGSRAKNLALEHYSNINPEAKREQLDKTILQRVKLEKEAETLNTKTDDVAKKHEQAEKWRAKIEDAKTPAKANEYEAKAVEYDEQGAALLEKHKRDAAEKLEKARGLNDRIVELEDAVKQAENDALRLKTTQDLWQLFAEEWAEPYNGENAAERGHRLEDKNASLVVDKLGIDPETVEYSTRMWISSENEGLAVSPDVSEKSEHPTWAIECKSLGSANHLKYVLPILARDELLNNETDELVQASLEILPEYVNRDARPFEYVPDDYKPQVLQYFIVNSDLETVYFSFYDDRFYSDKLAHQFVTVERSTVLREIESQKAAELETLRLRSVFSTIIGALF